MELTSRHKAFLVVLGLAGLALGVDRFFLAGEGASPSKAGATPADVTPAETRTERPAPAPSLPKPTLAARMDELAAVSSNPSAPPAEVGNAFVAEWDLTPRSNMTASEPAPMRAAGAWLRLTSVVPGRAAVINGTVVFVGKEHAVPADPDDRSPRTSGSDSRRVLRKITLVRAEERKVVVRSGDDEIELALPDRSELQHPRTLDDGAIVVNPTDSGGH